MAFIFVPCHAGTKGKDRENSQARCVPVVKKKVMDQHYILNAFSDIRRDECWNNQLDSTSANRIIELGMTLGVARNENYA